MNEILAGGLMFLALIGLIVSWAIGVALVYCLPVLFAYWIASSILGRNR